MPQKKVATDFAKTAPAFPAIDPSKAPWRHPAARQRADAAPLPPRICPPGRWKVAQLMGGQIEKDPGMERKSKWNRLNHTSFLFIQSSTSIGSLLFASSAP